MAGKDWGDLGHDLNRLIEDAVHGGNFNRLNDSIRNVFNQTFNGMDSKLSDFGDSNWDFDLSGKSQQQKSQQSQQNTYSTGAGTSSGNTHSGYTKNRIKKNNNTYRTGSRSVLNKLPYFAGNGKKYGATIVLLATGIFFLLISILPLLVSIINFMPGGSPAEARVIVLLSVFLAAGAALTAAGCLRIKLAGRFNRYVKILNGKDYTEIKALASYSHRSERDVIKDLRKMIKKGWFKQGHIDEQETCLMVSNESYKQYLDTMRNMKMKQQENEARKREEMKRKDRLTPEAAAILEKGREYIQKIRKSNDAIPGEEISNKIYRMEVLVARIFQQAEAYPENIGDLRRLMEYYLPTTMKLLDAYEELDRQPVQGEHITASKKEIEDTIDTLNAAFEKMLDSMFRERAWDVSADISVLETMLAQEGLTENDFQNIRA